MPMANQGETEGSRLCKREGLEARRRRGTKTLFLSPGLVLLLWPRFFPLNSKNSFSLDFADFLLKSLIINVMCRIGLKAKLFLQTV
jgi:hypothetical protein